MKLTKKILFLKIIFICTGAIASMLSFQYLLSSVSSLFDVSSGARSSNEEALANAISKGIVTAVPSLCFLMCSIWLGSGHKFTFWGIRAQYNPLILSVSVAIIGTYLYFSNPSLTDVAIAAIGGGILGSMVCSFFVLIDLTLYRKENG